MGCRASPFERAEVRANPGQTWSQVRSQPYRSRLGRFDGPKRLGRPNLADIPATVATAARSGLLVYWSASA